MGAVISQRKHFPLPLAILQAHGPLFRTLGLRQWQVQKIYNVFASIDVDRSGQLDMFEVLDHLKVRRTMFTERVFKIFDEDGSGSVDFREFVLSTWNYATLSKHSLVMFAFDLYDSDGSGSIGVEEMKALCKDVYGAEFVRSRLAREIVAKIERLDDTSIGGKGVSVEKFSKFCETHPGLLYPAFSFQLSLQKAIVGEQFWKRIARQRVTLPTGVQVKISDILAAHVDQNKFKTLAMHDQPGAAKALPTAMKEKVRKVSIEKRRDSLDFKEIYAATGTVAKRRRNSIVKSLSRKSRKFGQTFRMAGSKLLSKKSTLFSKSRKIVHPSS